MKAHYNSIDNILVNKNLKSQLIVSKQKFGLKGFFSKIILGNQREIFKTISTGDGNYLKGALEQTNDPQKYKKNVWAHDSVDKKIKYTFLENLILSGDYYLISEKENGYVKTSIAKYNKNRNIYENLFSILNQTFSESFCVLNSNSKKINELISNILLGRKVYKSKISRIVTNRL